MATTTTTTTKLQPTKKYYLSEFLDISNYSIVLRRMYEKKLSSLATEQKSIVDWKKELKKIQ